MSIRRQSEDFAGSEDEDVCQALQTTKTTTNDELELYFEECSSLYNLVLDALHCLTSKTISCEYLEMMASRLESKARELVTGCPSLETTVSLRLNTVCSAMEQLRLRNTARQQFPRDTDTLDSSKTSLCTEMRAWLHAKERQLAEHEVRMRKGSNLDKLLTDQKILQQEVKSEGQTLVNRLCSQLRREEVEKEFSAEDQSKKKTTIEVLRKRWLALYLDSLSLSIEIENKLEQFEESASESDPDLRGPPEKRLRTSVSSNSILLASPPSLASPLSSGHGTLGDEDTTDDDEFVIGYGESEFESMEREAVTPLSVSGSTSGAPTAPRKWDSVQQDIGYSSGENSAHDQMTLLPVSLSPATDMNRRRIECSPVKAFYRTVQLEDMSDLEVNRAINKDVADDEGGVLSDSMYMNVGNTTVNTTLTEYDEVMALMEDDDNDDENSPKNPMTDSFNTKWSEIRGRKTLTASVRGSQRRLSSNKDLVKSSCDASSEDSSECDTMEPDELVMSCSFNSSLYENSSPLKRQRSRRASKTSNLLLEQLGMEESFCSTRSELIGQKARTCRRKLRVRRMPRSMSDGEQLSAATAAAGLNTIAPTIQVSPPRTPLTRSTTRLLKRLDDELREDRFLESDTTAPEQSDAQVYEWDEYSPLAKSEMDDTMSDMVEMSPAKCTAEQLLSSVDDDFSNHFGGHTVVRLMEESRVHLETVHKTVECGNLTPKQLRNIDVIVSANLRQLDSAIRSYQQTSTPNRSRNFESNQLNDLRTQWTVLYEQLVNPVPRILAKVEKFATSLHQTSSMSALNGVHEISSKEDARLALDAVLTIKNKLSEERNELRELVETEKAGLIGALGSDDALVCITDGYDEAVKRIAQLVDNLDDLNQQWADWQEKRNHIAKTMSRIETYLKDGSAVEQQAIIEEMENCQQRMDSLETACNYLTTSLRSLQGDSGSMPDLHSEVSIFANALAQLRSKLESATRVPTPPIVRQPSPKPKKRQTRSKGTQAQQKTTITTTMTEPTVESPVEVVKSSRLIKTLLLMSLLAAMAAVLNHYVAGRSFGPHVEYVNGMPPF